MRQPGQQPDDDVERLRTYLTDAFRQCAGEAAVVFNTTMDPNGIVTVTIEGQNRAITNAVSDILYQLFSNIMTTPPYVYEGMIIRPDVLYLELPTIRLLLASLQENEALGSQQIAAMYEPFVKKHEIKLWQHQALQFLRSKLFTNPALDNALYATLAEEIRQRFAIDQQQPLSVVSEQVRDIYFQLVTRITDAIANLPASSPPASPKATQVFFREADNKSEAILDTGEVEAIIDGFYQPFVDTFMEKERAFESSKASLSAEAKQEQCEALLNLAKACEQYAPDEQRDEWRQRVVNYEALVQTPAPKQGPGL